MHLLDSLQIIHGELRGNGRSGYEECIMSISCRVLLRLEQRVEVPEGALDIEVGRHLFETHFEEDFTKFRTDFQKRVEVATFWWLACKDKSIFYSITETQIAKVCYSIYVGFNLIQYLFFKTKLAMSGDCIRYDNFLG